MDTALTIESTRDRVRAEFQEMPDLRLTAPQLQRLCGIDESMCRAALDALVVDGFLRARRDGSYMCGPGTAW